MVKKWIIILLIFALLVAACIIEGGYVNKSFKNLESRLVEAKTMLVESEGAIDTNKNINFLQDIENSWDENIRGLKSVIWHTGLKDIEIGLSRVVTYTEENNFTEAMTELNAVLDYLDTYVDDFKLLIENLL